MPRTACPDCGHKLSYYSHEAGAEFECQKCGTVFVPGDSPRSSQQGQDEMAKAIRFAGKEIGSAIVFAVILLFVMCLLLAKWVSTFGG